MEFHPGDTVYFINNKKIGCTGPHFQIQIFSFADLMEYMKTNGREIFLLLLPLTYIKKEDANSAMKIIQSILDDFFLSPVSEQIAKSILYGLLEE